MNVAFCINRKALRGLGVTLTSMLRNCSDSKKIKLWFLCAGLREKDKKKIMELLDSENFLGLQYFIDFDPIEHFGTFNPLHGDWTTYGRLLVPEIVRGDMVLYLDADLIVEVDVLEIANFDFNNHVIAAVGGGRFRNTLGNKFYVERLKISPDLEYFNAGVLLFNLNEWRVNKIKEKCLNIAKGFSMELPAYDQSILNIYCMGNFAKLPSSFNCSWLADQPRPNIANKMIIHFMGAPKPWDPLSFFLHNGNREWKKYWHKHSALGYHSLAIPEILRLWHLRRSYARCIFKKLKLNAASLQ